ncbi:MAG: hypothetical protein ACFCVD_03160 [Nodosilinea sp.]
MSASSSQGSQGQVMPIRVADSITIGKAVSRYSRGFSQRYGG